MTTNAETVQTAIAAHGMWKARLREAIESGQSSHSVATVRRNDACEFGMWLAKAGDDPRLADVRRLHTEFHQEAAGVLELALSGKRDDAERAIGLGGAYGRTSSALVMALKSWERAAA